MRTKLKTKFFILLFPIVGFGQTQIGDDFTSNIESSSFSLSKDGTVLAIGIPFDKLNPKIPGQVQIYKKNGDVWKQQGNFINEGGAQDFFGSRISLNTDGSIVAIGAPLENAKRGRVRIYQKTMNVWTQLSDSFNEKNTDNYFGIKISLNENGKILAIKSYSEIKTYNNNARTWRQIGNKIDLKDPSTFSLSGDGNILAIGKYDESGLDFSGVVRVYANISDTWTQIGKDIHGKKLEKMGFNVILSGDGTTLAVTSGYDSPALVRIYRNILGEMVQLGADIQPINPNGYYPNTIDVSLSDDGTILALKTNSSNGNPNTSIIIYKYTKGNWTPIGKEIYTKKREYFINVSLSGDGLTLATSSQFIVNNQYNKLFRVYDLSSLFPPLSTDRFETITAILYPNPASELVTLDLQKNVQLKEVNIYDALGKLIKTAKKNIIDVSTLSSGTYFFEIITDKGKTTKTVLKN
ncbi:T9SS type A sorting domain-containing protein [Flavobacterium poyangense]|uniref:T9SS type A sorting domain-containing protein n=1 Tax=Flavobacterium poyangense TaxID=2204302 RepID=UPI0014224C20|nr:T9SS type A sorting domain-containing protein [Flavobacterium sp. JXAS1]